MKSILLSAALAASVLIGIPAAAEAATNVRIYLGIPHYTYQVGPDYVYRKGYGWYRPAGVNNKLSCAQARDKVRNRGYRNVSTVECGGRTYTFRATRNGDRTRVYVNSRSGAVWRG